MTADGKKSFTVGGKPYALDQDGKIYTITKADGKADEYTETTTIADTKGVLHDVVYDGFANQVKVLKVNEEGVKQKEKEKITESIKTATLET
jgi:hypothetical protein